MVRTHHTGTHCERVSELSMASSREDVHLDLPPRPPIETKTDVKFSDIFTSLEELGKGAFGIVRKCQRKSDGLLAAAKVIKKTAKTKKDVLNEISIMNEFHHKRLICLYDAFEERRELIVVMELVTGGELFEKVVQDDYLTEKQVIGYMSQILSGVQHMHKKSIVHLDLKPENILCMGGGESGYEELKLIDFGTARQLKSGEQTMAMCGTPEFIAPEVINYDPVSLATDMWTIGVIVYVLLSGLSPFMGDDDQETLANVTAGLFDFDDSCEDDEGVFCNISNEAKEFITKLLVRKPNARLTVEDCLNHSWLKSMGTEKKLDVGNLKKFIARRRWQKTANTIKAVSRLTGGLNTLSDVTVVNGTKKDDQEEPATEEEEEEKPDHLTDKLVDAIKESNEQAAMIKDEAEILNSNEKHTEDEENSVEDHKEKDTTIDAEVDAKPLLQEKENDKELSKNCTEKETLALLTEEDQLDLPPRLPIETKTDVKFSDIFTSLEELGKGAFGIVRKCQRKSDGLLAAAKVIKKTAKTKKDVLNEISIMNEFHHKRLICLYDAFEERRELIVVMELVTGGELFEKVVQDDYLTEKQVIGYMSQILSGVQHMHKKSIVHLDLKPENILCMGGGESGYEELKLIDFGTARQLKSGEQTMAMCGTPEFIAPEVINYDPVSLATDMWTIGVIVYVLLSGLSPFMGDDDQETLANVTAGSFDFDDSCEDDEGVFCNISNEAKEFITKLLVRKPNARLTVDDCLNHSWLKSMGTEKKLDVGNLKKFIARRRWQKTANTIKAVSRLTGGLNTLSDVTVVNGTKKDDQEEPATEEEEEEKTDHLTDELVDAIKEINEQAAMIKDEAEILNSNEKHIEEEDHSVEDHKEKDTTIEDAEVDAKPLLQEKENDKELSKNCTEKETLALLTEDDQLDLPPRLPIEAKTDVKFSDVFTSLEELGKGAFGIVRKCQRKSDGLLAAAKVIKKTAKTKKDVSNEISIMNQFHHKRLICLYDAFEERRELIVVMELVTGGELFEKVVQDDNLTEKQVIGYMSQILSGVQHMHKKSIVHLDLKPENILCVGGGESGYEELKLIDFGTARQLKSGEQTMAMCGTPEFIAPEVINYDPVSLATDMWTIGVIVYVLLSGLSPFMGDDDQETLANVTAGLFDFDDSYEDDEGVFCNISDEAKEFITKLLVRKPNARLTVEDCLNHSWLKSMGTEKKLDVGNLKKFIARRRWQKTANTIKAVSRLTGGLNALSDVTVVNGTKKDNQEETTTVEEEEEKPDHSTDELVDAIKESNEQAAVINDNAESLNSNENHTKDEDNCVGDHKEKDATIGNAKGEAKPMLEEKEDDTELSKSCTGKETPTLLTEDDQLDLPPHPPIEAKTDVKFSDIFTSLEELGEGAFGVVRKCQRKSDNLLAAAKVIKKTAKTKTNVLNEISIMNQLHHKRLICLYDAFEESRELTVVMELVTGGELFEKVVQDDYLTEKQVIGYMSQILSGVQHMHKKSIVHLDLKPENILCVGGGDSGYEELKLIDFGTAKQLKPGVQTMAMCGTPEFIAPEVINYDPVSLATDMWTIGVIVYVLLSGLSPFMGDDDQETLANVTVGSFDFDDSYEDNEGVFCNISDEAKEFITKLLVRKPNARLTVDDCLNHSWLKSMGTEKKLDVSNLKKFIARRRWQKTTNTIKAVSRLTGTLNALSETMEIN